MVRNGFTLFYPSEKMIIRTVGENWKWIVAGLLTFFLISGEVIAQVPRSEHDSLDSIRVVDDRRVGGIEAGHAWKSGGFRDIFFRAFYEAEIDKVFLNAGVFSYRKSYSGFGFDFRLRMPSLFYPSGSHKNFSPSAGLSFTVWPSTVSVGIPFGIEYEFPVEHFPILSVSTSAAPQINLSSEKNTIVFDLRLGIRFD